MSEKKIVVPEGMRLAAGHATRGVDPEAYFVYHALEAALRWLSENPIAPTMAQAEAMRDSGHPCILDGVWYAAEWQRRMFLAPEIEVPEDIKDLLWWNTDPAKEPFSVNGGDRPGTPAHTNAMILEAFRRGQKSRA